MPIGFLEKGDLASVSSQGSFAIADPRNLCSFGEVNEAKASEQTLHFTTSTAYTAEVGGILLSVSDAKKPLIGGDGELRITISSGSSVFNGKLEITMLLLGIPLYRSQEMPILSCLQKKLLKNSGVLVKKYKKLLLVTSLRLDLVNLKNIE